MKKFQWIGKKRNLAIEEKPSLIQICVWPEPMQTQALYNSEGPFQNFLNSGEYPDEFLAPTYSWLRYGNQYFNDPNEGF